MPDTITNQPVGIENIGLGDITNEGVANGASPWQIAGAVKAWREDAIAYGRETIAKTDPEAYWNGTAQIDRDVSDALQALKLDEINGRVNALGFTSDDDKRGFYERLASANGNPDSTALSDTVLPNQATEKLVASDIAKIQAAPAFQLDPNIAYGNSIDVEGTTLARFSLRDTGKGNVDALVTFDKPAEATGKQIFPTKHPSAKNEDGSQSNVLMAGVGLDGKEYVIPTMVDGKKLSIDEAVAVARKNGLGKYPSFATPEEATKFAQENHGSIDENGFLKAPPKMESAIVTIKDVDLPKRIKEQEAKIAAAQSDVERNQSMLESASSSPNEAAVGASIGASEGLKYAQADLAEQQAILAGLKSKGGRNFALQLDLQEELKKEEYEGKMGDKDLWGDFVRGAKKAVISTRIATERAGQLVGGGLGDAETIEQMRQGLRDIAQSDQGSTARAFRGEFGDTVLRGAAEAGGAMATNVLPTGAISRVAAGSSIAKLFSREAARGLTPALGQAASASSMIPMSFGTAYAAMLDKADSYQKTDPAKAAQLRSMADLDALAQATIDFGTELIGGGHNPFLQRAGFANAVRRAPGQIVSEGLEEGAAGVLERGIKQPVTQDEGQPVTKGLATEVATGMVAAVPLIGSGLPFAGRSGTVEGDGMVDAPPAPGAAPAPTEPPPIDVDEINRTRGPAKATSRGGPGQAKPPPIDVDEINRTRGPAKATSRGGPGQAKPPPTAETFSAAPPPPAETPEQTAAREADVAILHDSASNGLLLLGGVGPEATEEKITSNALALMQGTKESADSLAAQVDMMVDPSKPKTAVFIDEGTPAVQEPIMAAVEAAKVKHDIEGDFGIVKVDGGMVLFDKAVHPDEAMVVQMANSGTLGQALGYGVASKPDVVSEQNRALMAAEEAARKTGTDLQQRALAALTILLQSPGEVEKAAVVTDGTPESIKAVKAALQKLASPTDKIVEVPAAQMPDVIAQRERHKADLEAALKRKQGRIGGTALPPLIKTLRGPTGAETQAHIIEFLNRNPIEMPPQDQRAGKGEWDWLGKGKNRALPFNFRNLIFKQGGLPIDTAIQQLREAGYFPGIAEPTPEDFGNALQAGIAQYNEARNAALNPQPSAIEQEEAATVAAEAQFAKDVLTPSETKEGYYPGDGMVGDTFTVDSEQVTVTDISEDGYVTLESKKWGARKIELGQQVFTDKPTGEASTDFLPPEETTKTKEKPKQTDMFAGTESTRPMNRGETVRPQDQEPLSELVTANAQAEAARNQTEMPLEDGERTAGAVSLPGAPLTPATGPSAPIAPIKPISEIIRDLAKGFDIPIRFGRLTSRNFGGYFKAVANLIASRKANDIPTVAHEIGHKLDELFKISADTGIRAELDVLGDPSTPDSMSSWKPGKTLAYKYGEGVGEFVRLYLTDPAKAQADAPLTFDYFEDVLDANPDFGDVMRQAQADIWNWRNAPFEARLDSSISIGSNPNKTRYRLTQLTRDAVDDLHVIRLAVDDVKQLGGRLKPSENPYLLARILRGSYGMADAFIRNGVIDFKTRRVTLGTSLEHALAPVAGRIDAFRRWIVAKRAKELHAQGKETGLDRGDVDLTVAKYDADPDFNKAFDDIKAWNDALLQYAVDAGYVTQEGADAMRAMHQDYVPMHRVFEIGAGESPSQEGAGAGRGLNVGTVGSFRRLGGSTRDIVDPLETMVRNAYSIITASEKSAINKAIGDLSKKHGMGKWVEKIATPKEVLKAPLEKVREQLEDAGADLTGIPDDLILQFFRDSGKAPYGENIIRVTHAGETTFYRLNSDLFDSFHALDMEEAGTLVKILSSPAQLLRAGVTLDPAFAAANMIRDALGSAVINKYRLFPFEAGLRGAAAMVGNPQLIADWAASGADNSMEVNFFDREATAAFLREKITNQLTPAERALIFTKGPLQALRWIGSKSEQATRVGEYSTALDRHLNEGMAEGEARRLAAFESRDRQDFAKGGAKTKSLRRMGAFWNAGLQANVAIYNAFKERPIRSTIQGLMYITLPTLLLLVKNWDDEDYWDRPQWERDVFWLVPFGKDASGHTRFARIPKPFILGIMFGALPERMYSWSKKNDPKAFDGFAREVASQTIPNPAPQVATLIVGDLLTGKRGWDFFRGREVVPESVADLPASLQWTEQTSLTARKIGALLDFSPMKIDHIIAGTTGGLGRQLVHQAIDRAIEAATGDKRTAANTVPGGRFFASPAGINSKAVEDFYSDLADLREKKAGAKFLDDSPTPKGEKAKQKAAEELGEKSGYDYKHLQLMERASRDITVVRDKIKATDDPDEKQKLYLQIKDIAEKAMGDTYKPPVAKSKRKVKKGGAFF